MINILIIIPNCHNTFGKDVFIMVTRFYAMFLKKRRDTMTLLQPLTSQPQKTFDFGDDSTLLANVKQVAHSQLLPKVLEIDKGYYPLAELSALGKVGAFSPFLKSQGENFWLAIQAMATISEVCGTTGFVTWCHQVCGLYLDQSENQALKERFLSSHVLADTFGGTALSNPMKTWANIEPMILRAKKTADGYVISGTLPWISHIAPDQYCGAVATIENEQGQTTEDVFFLLQFDKQRRSHWSLKKCPTFAGMEGSSTWKIELNNYPICQDEIIAQPSDEFVKNIRGAFVLMQMGIGAGIIQGAINDIEAVSDQLGHVNQFLEDQAGTLQISLNKLLEQTQTLAKTPFDTSKDFFLDVLDLRIQGAKLSLKATQAAMLHQGARGYLMTSNPQRRLREAQFVAIVTPAIKHLRYLSHQILSDV